MSFAIKCLVLFISIVSLTSAIENRHKTLESWQAVTLKNDHFTTTNQTQVYALNTELFSDYALKFRTITLPKNRSILWDGQQLTFPIGTLLTKTFYYAVDLQGHVIAKPLKQRLKRVTAINLNQHRLLETRLLQLTPDGWQAFSYLWNDRVNTPSILGEEVKLTIQHIDTTYETFNYFIPDINQCQQCHVKNTAKNQMQPLGFSPTFLNSEFFSQAVIHQNKSTSELTASITPFIKKMSSSDLTPSIYADDLENSARRYLSINCSHCHNPQGSAQNINISLDYFERSLYNVGLCKTPVTYALPEKTTRIIWPGHAERSMLLWRLQSQEPSLMMPELGRALVDHAGVTLINRWISRIDLSCQAFH
ncbi:MAG: hypothetical protein AAGB12_05250 [Pseudomonadota bacterium]